ncbi:glutathione S-transferase C-terminal-like protein [Coniophora puteana RWD-64-598 SS2]|uniref:glutathione transferase n=1 Tax=Coniophora puteana (strain RWD-64-598) TaxID=741705 RepID=A0A5M3MNG3_CONPW|nr:glutathione S-transferase C-terminal-like protein [Coniophora puteana RWD-64-598 SS2]EIW80708.1 glutathione S-transferase C-terminal-like protein [Coniophora puteana RWD-64-598 SS2]
MALKLCGSPISTRTRTVAATCKELNVPYEFVNVDLAGGEHKTAEFTAAHPFSQIPYIDEDGFKLFESRAISRYLAKKYAGDNTKLIPTGPKEEALFEQGVSIESSNFYPSAIGYASEKVFKPYNVQYDSQTRAADCLATLNVKLDAYDVLLGKQKYIGGNEYTLADIFRLAYGALALIQGGQVALFESRPSVARWWKDISNRKAWLEVIEKGV